MKKSYQTPLMLVTDIETTKALCLNTSGSVGAEVQRSRRREDPYEDESDDPFDDDYDDEELTTGLLW